MNWYDKAAFYHIYPLGFCGCPKENDFASAPVSRILKVLDIIPHLKECGFSAVYFGPIFESSKHGYDTADYLVPDRRLGTEEDFKRVFDELHANGIKVVIDGVFNHVGRDFWAFKDVREHGFSSRYKDWFHIRDGGSPYGEPFFYEGWEGHYELVKLNLYNGDVKNYLKDCITKWRETYKIDGLRLDVAYCLDENFLRELHGHCKWLAEDFWLMGETLHGDYNRWMSADKLDSVTNYECYKGLYSSFNDMNMFEIAHSLNRQFGKEQWCLYTGKNLYTFVDNHDVSRIATMLKNKEHMNPIYSLLFTMPGIPSVYYGSEYGWEGDKKQGDDALRVEFKLQEDTELTKHIAKLAKFRTESDVLAKGGYNQMQLTNRQYAFMREYNGKRVITALNVDGADFTFNLNAGGSFKNIFTGEKADLGQPLTLSSYSSAVFAEE
ncbi:MAG: maltodextrin glucosidase [Ruminococcaceae bacterium]|nr:maltodextrin glucosidase [Oscillospiraceae bacterium]